MKKFNILVASFLILCSTLALAGPKAKKEKFSYVKVTTTMGNCIVKLYNETPLHRDNMLKLVNEKFYDSLLFHRVIKGFMIQGGDPVSKRAADGVALGNGGPEYTVPAEFNDNLYHKKGVIAAARDNNPSKASSSCQFYLVQGKTYTDAELDNMEKRSGMIYTPEQRTAYKTIGGTPFLDKNYTVYGEVIEGIELIDKIADVKTAPGDRPVENIRMTMTVLKKYKPAKKK